VPVRARKLNTSPGPNYGLGILGKCLTPTTSKGLRQMAAKYFEHKLANQSLMFYALVINCRFLH